MKHRIFITKIASVIRCARKARRKLAVIALIVLTIGTPIIMYMIANARPAEAAWWNQDWAYRKALPISAHTAAENNVYLTYGSAAPTNTTTFMEAGTAETQDISFYNPHFPGSGSSPASDSQAVAQSGYSTTRSLKTTVTSGSSDGSYVIPFKPNLVSDSGSRITFYARFTSVSPSQDFGIFVPVNSSDATAAFGLALRTTGKLAIFNTSGTITAGTTGTTVLSPNTDYRISIVYTITSSSVDTITVYLNGNVEISVSNITVAAATATTFELGISDSPHSPGVAMSAYFAHIFVDNGSSGDPGDIRVTAKRPLSNGSANNWTTNGSAGAYGSGNARYVNERPLNNTDYMSTTGTSSQVEEYSIEGASAGDIDISSKNIFDYMGWVDANASTTLTANIILANSASNVSLTTTENIFYKIAGSTTYPAGNTDIGMNAGTAAGTKKFYEGGIMVAYSVSGGSAIDTSDTTKFQSDCGDLRFTDASGNLLPYYIVSGCGTSSTLVHVFLKSFPAGAQTFYYYYGNPNATNGFSSSDFATAATGVTYGTFGSEEQAPSSPNLYLKFDEGYGTSANDSSSNGATGTLAGNATPSWQTDDMCVFSKCLYFPGGTSASKVTVSKTVSGVKTVSFWVRPASSSAALVDLNAADASITASAGTITASNFTSPTYYVNGASTSSPTLTANQWNYVTVTTGTAITASAIKIANVKGDYLKGSMDDFRLYDFALSADQVKANYNARGSSNAAGVLGTSIASATNALSNGLEGYWKMDGSSTGQSATDYSGNQVTLANNGSASFSSGKFGSAPTFDGSSKYFNVNTNPYSYVTENSVMGGNATVSKPSGVMSGDLLILLCGNSAGTSFSSSGFTSFNSIQNTGALKEEMFYKIAGGSEPSQYTCTNSFQTQILVYRNIDNASPTDLSDVGNAASGTTMTAPTITTTAANDLVTRVFATWVSNTISSAPATQRINVNDGGGNAVYASDELKSTAGATGTATANQDTSGAWVSMTAAFKTSALPSSTFSGVKTVSFWVKPGSTTDNFINLASGVYINASSGTISATGWTNPIIYVNGVQTSTITSGTWQHVVITSTTGITANSFEVGRANGSYAANNTQMAEVRLYNRVLSPTDILTLYSWTPGPVGYWNFEEGQGSTVYDRSVINSDDGTWEGTLGKQYAPGKFGKTGNFNNIDNAVNMGVTPPTLDLQNGFTAEAWVKLNSANNATIIGQHAFIVGGWRISYDNTNGIQFALNPNGGGGTTINSTPVTRFNANQWYHVAAVWVPGTSMSLYVNGTLNASSTTSIPSSFDDAHTQKFRIGGSENGGSIGDPLDGQVDEAKMFNYTRTAKQIVSDMNGGHPNVGSPVGSPVAYWKFDEGYGTTVHSSGNCGSDCDSTMENFASPATSNSGWTQKGKINKALAFDGIDDDVSIPNATQLDFTGINTMSVSAWYYSQDNKADEMIVFNNSTGTDGWLMELEGGQLGFQLGNGSSLVQVIDPVTSLNGWHHATATWDGATIKLYKDGKLVDSKSQSGTIGTSPVLYIGRQPLNSARFFDGMLDEIKIYNYALTSSEVAADMNQGKTLVLGALSDTSNLSGGSVASNSAEAEYCVPGGSDTCTAPVARYDFEEGTGSTVNDTSGNANTGTWNGTLGNQWTTGYVGKGGNFDGSTNYVSAADANSLDLGDGPFTIEFWAKRTRTGVLESLISKGANAYTINFRDVSPAPNVICLGKSGVAVVRCTNTAITDTKWHHYAFTKNGSSRFAYLDGRDDSDSSTDTSLSDTASALEIGRESGANYFSGSMDGVRIYKYVRTPAQIAWDYNRGGPVGYWKMDECQGTAIHDSSGNGNNGTLTIGGSGSQTVVGTCSTPTDGTGAWYNGRVGKYNYSMSFDGNDDFIDTVDTPLRITGALTMTAWVNSAQLTGGTFYGVMAKAGGGQESYDVYIPGTTGLPTFRINNNAASVTANTAITTGKWYQLTFVYIPSTSISIYINGNLDSQNTTSIPSSITSFGQDFHIGDNGGISSKFNGQIDDVRLYNYALTASQIRMVYNQGAGVRFGPLTGAP